MENHEHHRVRELEGFAEAVDQQSRETTGILTVRIPQDPNKPGEKEVTHTHVSCFPRNEGATLRMAIMLAAQIGAKIIKALLLIFNKLDSIEGFLLTQELRERNKDDLPF